MSFADMDRTFLRGFLIAGKLFFFVLPSSCIIFIILSSAHFGQLISHVLFLYPRIWYYKKAKNWIC